MVMRLSTKGQVTIPQAVRTELGIGPGSAVDFMVVDGKAVMTVVEDAAADRGDRLLAALRSAQGQCQMSTEDLMALTRDWDEAGEAGS